MGDILIFAVIVVILLLILCSHLGGHWGSRSSERLTSDQEPPLWPISSRFRLPISIKELTDIEQAPESDETPTDGGTPGGPDPSSDASSPAEIQQENDYISKLPRSTKCNDNYKGCPAWAANNECVINPEYMLYNCAKSCQACALNDQEKYNITYIYNKRPVTKCVRHGEDYPSMIKYLNKLFMIH
jgi:hypothetical protein